MRDAGSLKSFKALRNIQIFLAEAQSSWSRDKSPLCCILSEFLIVNTCELNAMTAIFFLPLYFGVVCYLATAVQSTMPL